MSHALAVLGILGSAVLAVRYLARPAHWRHDLYYLRNWARGLVERARRWAEAPKRQRRWWEYLRQLYRSGAFGEDGT